MIEQNIKELAVLELIKNLRIAKRQLRIVRGMDLNSEEVNKINKAIVSTEQDFNLFKI